MAHQAFDGALDTPRTNIGDATYLSRQPDFADISQEASFQSPEKDGDLLQQLRNGRSNGVSIRTPRQRGPLADRRNLPPSVGGAEFTPLLKSATRNSSRRVGKENNSTFPNTPAALGKIDEDDLTPLPRMEASIYSIHNQSYVGNDLPVLEASSAASTPIALPQRRGADKGPLQDGNQLSLREQENVIDRIEKENFGLKLKIHFLEDALRKAGPGFSEAALKENTELKVDKVTMQRELHRYKKHLTTAETDLETYRQQMLELQEKAKQKYASESQVVELEKLRHTLEDREADIDELQRQIDQHQQENGKVEKLEDSVQDLEAELREKDRIITKREDELEDLKDKLEEAEDKAKDLEQKASENELAPQQVEEIENAQATIRELQQNIDYLENKIVDMKTEMDDAFSQKDRAEHDLEELQEEMANKSVVTKGLSRQIEEKVSRLQSELDKSSEEYASLEKEMAKMNQENHELRSDLQELRHDHQGVERERQLIATKIEELETELLAQADAKDLLQSRQDSLTDESSSLQREVQRLQKEVQELEGSLAEERQYTVELEKDLRGQYQDEMQRLNDEVSDLQAEIREKDNLYDNDSEKWATQKQMLEAERERAEEKAAGLQRTIDRLRDAEGGLSSKESKLKEALQSEAERHRGEEAILNRQVDDLQDALEARQALLVNLRNELSAVRDELRTTQIGYQTQVNKVVALEDEVEVLHTNIAGTGNAKAKEEEAAKKECGELKTQLKTLQQLVDSATAATSASEQNAQQSIESMTQLRWQLSDTTTQLERANREKELQQDQLDKIRMELCAVQSTLAETKAERDNLNGELHRTKMDENDTLRLDQERLDLRTTKMKLDNDIRRLKDENKSLVNQRAAIEKTLEEEIERAAEEEERLGREILELQGQMRLATSSETQDLASARRTIRELERKLKDHERQLATAQPQDHTEGNSELSFIRKDLSTARQKELDLLQRESAQKDIIKGLKRQISELERQIHASEVSRLMRSPKSRLNSERDDELLGLREQLSTAHQSMHNLKLENRDTERKALQVAQDLQLQLNDIEDQKLVLEEVLEEARLQAEEEAAQHERTLQRMKQKLDKAERDRNATVASHTENNKHSQRLRKSQTEIENLEHDVLQQQELIDGLVASEAVLRRKLERARSERAAYRMTAEKLQRDIQQLKKEEQSQSQHSSDDALETIVRAAESAEGRHKKELRGAVMQMEWMQARWEREVSLRSDVAYGKKFLQLQLDIANACNKAQLRELEHIRTNLLQSRKQLTLPKSPSAFSPTSSNDGTSRPKLKTLLNMARFIVRMRIAARNWAQHEVVRKKLAVAADEKRRVKRSGQLKVVRADVC